MKPSVTYETMGEKFPPILSLASEKSSCRISLHGGHILSFIPKAGQDILWVSRHALYQEGKAIRGGIPICWPWFGAHPEESSKPSHGFARIQAWEVTETGLEGEAPFAVLTLRSSETTKTFFDYDFQLRLKVVAGDSLHLSLTTINTDLRPFTITEALHSYFSVTDIAGVRVSGLEGKPYIDQLQNNQTFVQQGDVTFTKELDRIYRTDAPCLIKSPSGSYRIDSSGSRSSVVWNPWVDKARRLADFGDEEYRQMVCVETANAGPDQVTIPPGDEHTLSVTIGKASS